MTNLSNYRYERKFIISNTDEKEIEHYIKLHPKIFSEIYHERYVNNIYFDSLQLQNYFDNINGVFDRIKARIRWYGNLFGDINNPVIELKIKKGSLGRKFQRHLKPFMLNNQLCRKEIADIFRKSNIPNGIYSKLLSLKPTLLNRYKRKYYLSSDKNYRLTTDSAQEFYRIEYGRNSFLNRNIFNRDIILELKYDKDFDNEASGITNHFLFRLTKNSKYINGIELINQIHS